MRSTRAIALAFMLVFIAVVAVVAFARPARAWPTPIVAAAGGACTGGQRAPVEWEITNLETEFPLSPATVTDVVVKPAFPTQWTSPITLKNTGSSKATAETIVPPGFSGKVTLSFTLKWSGKDGADERPGFLTVTVSECEQPTVRQATTSTTSPSTTTSTSTTSTSVAVLAETVEPDPVPVAPPAEPVRAKPPFTG